MERKGDDYTTYHGHKYYNLLKTLIEYSNKVYSVLGHGHNEVIYHNALKVELRINNIKYETEKITPIYYEGYCVGNGRADLVVDTDLTVELKATTKLSMKNKCQLRKYLINTNSPIGIVINFPQVGEAKNATLETNIGYMIVEK
tara:strand:- start:35 stop:466 length:432 start_codon:yes stop_codon:yes gene_type:complete